MDDNCRYSSVSLIKYIIHHYVIIIHNFVQRWWKCNYDDDDDDDDCNDGDSLDHHPTNIYVCKYDDQCAI